MKIKNELTGKPYGMIDGRRVYRVKRGHFQIQHAVHPAQSAFDGTKRECERAMKSKMVKF